MHSFTSCLMHCVWATKERRPLIKPDLQQRLWPYLGGIARENKMKALVVGGVEGGIPLSFLNAWLNSPTLDLSEFLTGIDQVKLNRAAMDRNPIPIAPLPEQQEIVRRVEGLFALADQLELRLAEARGQVEKLTPSFLAHAFAGQLVPQDPTDEPAEKLLERINTNHETKSGKDARK